MKTAAIAIFISRKYTTISTFYGMARRVESKTLKIIIIRQLDAEIYEEQVYSSDVAQLMRNHTAQTLVQTAINAVIACHRLGNDAWGEK